MPASKKNDVLDALSANDEEQSGMTDEAVDQLQDGLGLGENPDENPLSKMDKVTKEMPDKKEQSGAKLDPETIENMLMTGDNTEGMFTPDEKKPEDGEPPLHEDVDEKAKTKLKGKATPEGKYKDQFKRDILKNPQDYTVKTPKGEMTIAEAMRKGYNPITKQFEKEHDQEQIKNKHMSGLNDADREVLERMTSPSNAQVAPADAEKYGLSPESPMIRQGEQNPSPEMNPMMQGIYAPNEYGMPMPPEAMQGAPNQMPPEPQPQQAGGQPDIASLLGGMA